MAIRGSVGRHGLNDPADVQIVETRLADHRRWLDPMPTLLPDGTCGLDTIAAIRRFQETAAALYKDDIDGLVSSHGFTIKRLEMGNIPFPRHRVFDPVCWAHPADELSDADFTAAAKTLDCEVAAVRAVAKHESPRGPWDDVGRPNILFERHKFGKYSKHLWDRTHPDISSKSQSNSKHLPRDRYGRFAEQYGRLYRAATLDEDAALRSASWGAFQIMGENFATLGYTSVAAFVDAMLAGEGNQLRAFVKFIQTKPGAKDALRALDWNKFALRYNGQNQTGSTYAKDVGAMYDRFKALEPKAPKVPKAGAR